MNDRYERHIRLKEVGLTGQEKLSMAKVLVIGAGGLGCPALQYLAAAGVGTIGIVDHDTVSLSNLQRQILYTEADLNDNKAITAKRKLEQLNSEIKVHAHPIALTAVNCITLLKNYDMVIDGTDNFTTRYLISDATCQLEIPMIYGSLYKFEGQVAVFNYYNGPSYRCLFPEVPKDGEIPNCNDVGVLGVLPGSIGILQATEALKIILNLGIILNGKLRYINILTNEQHTIEIGKNDAIIKHIKSNPLQPVMINDCELVRPITLSSIQPSNDILWVDVRGKEELPRLSVPGLIEIPLDELEQEAIHLKNSRKKIIFCQTGARALKATQQLNALNIENCHSLKDGAYALDSWLKIYT